MTEDKIKTISIENFNNRMKSIETKSLKRYGTSPTWVTISNHFNDCIIETDKNTVTFDECKYKKIRAKMLEGDK